MLSRLKPTTPRDPHSQVLAVQDPKLLADQLASARQRLALLDGDATVVLSEVPSEQELIARREQAEWRRAELLKLDRAELADQLAAADALRDANKTIREADIRDAVDARKAVAAQRRSSAPTSQVAELHRYDRWTSYGCAGIILAGLVWSAINVQQNMAPGGTGDPMFWASFLVDGMISGLLIILALGSAKVQQSGHTPSATTRAAEIALFMFALGMNTYPYLRDTHYYEAVTHGIAPVMIGASMWVLHTLGKDYNSARKIWIEQIGPDETVHLPQIQTVHRAGPHSNPPALTETVHRAPVDGHVQDSETVQHARAATFETVQHADPAADQTAQFPRTAADETVHRALHAPIDTADASGAQEPAHTAHHTVQPTAHPASLPHEESLTELHEKPAQLPAQSSLPVAVEAAETVQIDDRKAAAPTAQAGETVLTDPAGEVAADPEPWTPAEETAQFPSTVHPNQVAETVHRAPVGETVHRAARPNRAPVQVEETVHRAPEVATEQGTGEDDAELWALAAEVHARLPRKGKFVVGDVARVLIANRRQGFGADRIYRDKIGPHRDTTARWLELATQVEQERTGAMAAVINLR
ncbi:hypothetical protein [Nocardia tengchongensis]|uniref:hypothetical protein n=1 Tax=Nocardia tengchongensis TaxID=2055889 RepID=UPI00368AE08D